MATEEMVQQDADVFASAWDEANNTVEPSAPLNDDFVTEPEEPVEEDNQVVEEDVEEAVEELEEPVVVEAPQPNPVDEDTLERLRKAEATANSMLGRLKAAQDELKQQQQEREELVKRLDLLESSKGAPPEEKPKTERAPNGFNDWAKEWPDFVEPVKHLAKQVATSEQTIQSMIDAALEQFASKFESKLAVVDEIKEESTQQRIDRMISSKHPDWKDLINSGQIKEWIDSKPTYLRNKLTEIFEASTIDIDEAISLFDDFKAEKQHLLNKTTKRKNNKKEAMVGVTSTAPSPNVSDSDNNDDFAAAWADAIAD